ncbi:hypothetical protein ACFX13_028521 [Malus domestica]
MEAFEADPGEMRDVIKVDELSKGLLAAFLGPANNLLEDQNQVESGPLSSLESGSSGTFFRIYDDHGSPETNDYLFQHLKKRSLQSNSPCQ